MSGLLPSQDHGALTPSHSVGKIPLRKQGSTGPDGNRGPQPRAEFRGNRRTGKQPAAKKYYESYHGKYDELNRTSKVTPRSLCREQPYAEREPLPQYDTRTTGIVGPELDWSVRSRNLPIIFEKQMREVGRFAFEPIRKVHKILFPNDSTYHCHPKDRPQVGCCMTKFWSEEQVSTWTRFANAYHIRFSGYKEYQIPSSLLGKTVRGTYYSIPSKVWPKPEKVGETYPFLYQKSRSDKKRSEFARIRRSLLKRNKEVVVKPLDFSKILIPRRQKSRRAISKEWSLTNRRVPISEYMRNYPMILSVNAKHPPQQVPPIVVEALKKLAAKPTKMVVDRPWLGVTKVTYSLPTKTSAIISRVRDKKIGSRLRPFFSTDGNIYALRAAIDNSHIFSDHFENPRQTSDVTYSEVRDRSSFLQSYLDDEDIDEYPATLGSWKTKTDVLGSW